TWEWQRANGAVVEQYLSSCTGNAVHAAQGLSVWSSTSVEHMLEWVCSFNQAHPADRVHFMGFDVQQAGVDLDRLSTWLTAHAASDAPALIADLAHCDRGETADTAYHGDYSACTTALAAIQQYLDDHGAALEAATSHEDVELTRIARIGASAWQ